ncbi:dihydrodipicolinate reductase [Alkalibacterium putridalgicola]|uniref:4-hydroxy-tetrahydrodipicolinate reductase n=1 Tax=Alkalibacterium putridalgicola TaxID=426703 RepID=A0A1H7X598_9LACT|nr:4-hydroxy-tetrahydrodipicolinate reductase [Alkalibacterium putridalgicola]GEK90268.1 4-hydroxy-tetrahydrodipicolinate reductase [Alkalibacterium putridalgicola]SEM28893.1 dihydrodipicolinate reductase [Alkalibacterium putridalgicola]
MKLLLVGYGAMNKRVAKLAEANGHEIVGVLSPAEENDCPYPLFDSENEDLPEADCLIDFSHPTVTKKILTSDLNIPMVIATTGEKETLLDLMDKKAETAPVFFSANMSYGVHIVTQLLETIAPLMDDYDIEMIEKHHNQKIDAPSGTLIKLLDAIKDKARPDAREVYDRSQVTEKRDKKDIGISTIRGGTIVGEHEVLFAGHDEVISVKHSAQSKDIFARGALKVAEQLIKKENGYYTYNNLGV